MSIEQKIINILRQQFPQISGRLEPGCLEVAQERTFHLHHDDLSLFLKWIPDNDIRGLNEIRVNREILANTNIPAPRLLFVANTEAAFLAGWEWLDGTDLRSQHRNYLPEAFARLGRFHAAQRRSGPVCSPTTRQAFDTVRDMLRVEAAYLCSFYDASFEKRCWEIFSWLEVGYPTFIHGDIHPGNILLTADGLKFVDWGYGMLGLNLSDLDYVQSVDLNADELPWWIITPSEAETVLPAYFHACGLAGQDYQSIHRAVMLWNALHSHYNCLKNNFTDEAAACRRNIEQLTAGKEP